MSTMATFDRLIVVLCALVLYFSRFQVNAYYGIVSVQYGSGDQIVSTEYCVTYDPLQHELPTELDKSAYRPLADLLPSELCEAPKASLEGHVAAVLRGNCTFTEKGLHAQTAKAEGALIVSKTGTTVPSFNTTVSIDIPVAIVGYKDYEDLKTRGQDPSVALYSPIPPVWDYSMIVIWLMATGTLAIGGYWAGLMGYGQYKRQKRHERRDGQGPYHNVSGGSDSSESDEEEGEEQETVVITPVLVVGWVLMIMALLLLLFFFYNQVVYVVIALYCMGAWSGMHTTLLPIFQRVFPCRERLPLLPVIKKRPTVTSAVLWLACGGFVLTWFFFRHEDFAWILLDFLGICFCISVLKVVRLPNFKTCFLLLSLLFVYDIFFVFVTPHLTTTGESVMVKVATGGESASEQIPVLLTVPRLCHSAFSVCNVYSMLGFGDILVPGLLVGFCHTHDLKVKAPRIYYIFSVISYGLGLLVTFVALIVMKTGQPALLYLVPCTVLTTLAVGAARGELALLWHGGPYDGSGKERRKPENHPPAPEDM